MKIFPILNLKCPNCGSEERVAELAMQTVEASKGIKRAGSFASLEQRKIPIVSASRVAGLSVPVVVHHYDVCADCGTVWCTKAEIKDAPIQVATKRQN